MSQGDTYSPGGIGIKGLKIQLLRIPVSQIDPTQIFELGRTIYGTDTSSPAQVISHKNGDGVTQYQNLQELFVEPLSAITGGRNGITPNGSYLELGGPLIQPTTVSFSSTTPLSFTELSSGSSVGINSTGFSATYSSGSNFTSLIAGKDQALMQINSGASTTGLIMDYTLGMRVSDAIFSKGLVYTDDYSSLGKLDSRWIPDWGAVTDAIAEATSTATMYFAPGTLVGRGPTFSDPGGTIDNPWAPNATNGLSISDGSGIVLGGPLTGNTTINTQNHVLQLTDSSLSGSSGFEVILGGNYVLPNEQGALVVGASGGRMYYTSDTTLTNYPTAMVEVGNDYGPDNVRVQLYVTNTGATLARGIGMGQKSAENGILVADRISNIGLIGHTSIVGTGSGSYWLYTVHPTMNQYQYAQYGNLPALQTTVSSYAGGNFIGQLHNFSDSTTAAYSAVITGGGSNSVLGRWNGTQWIVVGGSSSGSVAWASITGKPTTLGGYGITDAVNSTSTQTVSGVKTFSNDINAQGNIYMTGNIFANDTSPYYSRDANDARYLLLTGGTMSGNLIFNGGASITVNSDLANIGVKSTTNTNLYTAATYNSFELHNGANNYTSYLKSQITVTDGTNAFYINYPTTLLTGTTSVTFRNVGGTIALLSDITSATPAWSSITGKPTTLGGYGITDAYPLTGNPSSFITLSSLSNTAPITYNSSTGAIGITQATTSTNGYLSNTDWNTFNNKQSSLKWVNVLDYGATGNGTTNDTTSIQNAANAISSTGGVLYFPPGNYLISSAISISNSTQILGAGGIAGMQSGGTSFNIAISTVTSNSLTANAFTIGADNCSVDNICIRNSNTSGTFPSSGAGIVLNKSIGFRMNDASVLYFYDNINFVNGWDWKIDGCHFSFPVRYNMRIQDVALPDAGDQSITSSWFYCNSTSATSLRYESGGGLKLNNVKFNAGGAGIPNVAIDVNMQASTVLFQMSNCSVENYGQYGLKITAASGVSFNNVNISNNEFSGGAGYPIYIDPSIGGGSMGNISIGTNFLNTTDATKAALTVRNCNVVRVGDINFGVSTILTDFTGSFAPNGTTKVNLNRNQGQQTLSISAGVANWDYSKSTYATITLTGNTTVNQVNNVSGDMAYLSVVQDATGGRTLTMPGVVFIGNSVINPSPNAISYIRLYQNIATVISDYAQQAKVYSSPNGFAGYTVSTLPAGNLGDQTYVTDATTPTYLGTLTGGGSVKTPVFYNGSAWQALLTTVDQSFAPTWTGQHIWQNNSASSTLTPYIKVANNTTGLASSGTTYYSPAISLLSPVYTGGASSNMEFRLTSQSNQSNNFGYFTISSYIGGGSGTNVFQVDNFGNGFTSGSWGVHGFSVGTSTTTDGLTQINFTAATSGAQVQNSYATRWMGAAWTGSVNNWTEWTNGVRNTAGAPPVSKLFWAERTSTNNSGSYTDIMSLDNSSNLALLNTISVKHIIGSSSAPTIAAGTGAGTSPTVSVSGNDLAHKVTITTGTSPTASATVATITFNVAYGAAPKIILTPVNSAAAALSGTTQIYVDDASTTTTVYVIKVGSGGLTASTTYLFYAQIAQ